MSTSGSLFDLEKLDNIAKEYLARQSAEFVYEGLLAWAKIYDPELAARMTAQADFYKAAINVGRGGEKPRKDYGSWSAAAKFLAFYDTATFRITDACPENADGDMKREILTRYLNTLDFADSQEEWFAKVKLLTEELGYAVQPKKYKKNPEMMIFLWCPELPLPPLRAQTPPATPALITVDIG